MAGAPWGELIRHDRFFQLGRRPLVVDQAPDVQSVALTILPLSGAVPGSQERWIDALLLRLAGIILQFSTLLLLIVPCGGRRWRRGG